MLKAIAQALVILNAPETATSEGAGSGSGPVEMTVQDLNAHIDNYIGKAVSGLEDRTKKHFDDIVDGLRKDLLPAESAERGIEARKRAETDFAALSGSEQRQKIADFKKGLFDARHRGTVVKGSDNLPWVKGGDDLEIGSGKLFTRLAPLLIRAKGDWNRVVDYANESGNKDLADLVQKTLAAGDFDAGGAFVPEAFAADYIGFLYATSVVRQAGARTIDLSERGNLTLGRINSTAVAYWVGENDEITKSELGTGQLKLELKKLGVFVPVSDDLIKYAVGAFEEIIRDDMTTVAALKEDLAFLRGDGTSNQPKGILNWAASGNKFATAGNTQANKVQDLVKAQYKVEGSNVAPQNPAWFMHARERAGLMLTLTTDGAYAFMPELVMNSSILGVPAYVSNQIPKNLDTSGGGDNDETDVYYVEMSQAVIGEGMQVEVEESNSATYNDGSAQRNAFQRFERVIRLGHEVDFVMRHEEAAAVIRQVTWGAALDT